MRAFLLLLSAVVGMAWCHSIRAASYEREPNDLLPTASPLTPGQPVTGNVATVSDVDVYSLDTGTSSSLQVMFRRRQNRSFTFIVSTVTVQDAAGNTLASVDVDAADHYTTFQVGVTPGQQVFVSVSGCDLNNDSCRTDRSDPYELLVSPLPAPSFESEPNDSLPNGDVVQPNAWVFGQMSAKTDVDLYRIDLATAGDFSVHVTRSSVNFIYVIATVSILDENGLLLNADDIAASDGQGRVVLSTDEPKVVFVRITSCQSGSSCDLQFSQPYQLTMSFIPSTGCLIFRDGFECSAMGKPTSLPLPAQGREW